MGAALRYRNDVMLGMSMLVFLLNPGYSMAGWTSETVDGVNQVGEYTSLALDSDGNPRISYYDQTNHDLKYASFDGEIWMIETIDSLSWAGQHTSLALDSDGSPRISYYDETNKDLKYARYDDGWQIETVDSEGWVGQHTSLALAGDGSPRISYYDETNKDLKYARYDDGWQIETVDSEGWVGQHASLALAGDGTPRISCYDATNQYLHYVFFEVTNGTTSSTAITTTTTSAPSTCFLAGLLGEDSEESAYLRNVRDTVLSTSSEGRELVRLYYQWSPFLAGAAGRDEKLQQEIKAMVVGLLRWADDRSQ